MSEPVSKKAQVNTLQTLPLELRLRIYEFVALRPTGPHLLLKEWLEKIDPDIDTTTPAFGQTFNTNGDLVGVDGDYDDGIEVVDLVMDEEEEDEDEDEDEEDEEDNGEDGDMDDDDDDDDADDDLDDVDDDEDLDDANNVPTLGANGFQWVTGANGTQTIATTFPTGRYTKYRHTLPIIKLNACPPPIELLLVSHQIKNEAYAGIYNKMMLEIDATKGFRHLEFFLTILNYLQTEDTTPLRHIRNAAVTFVWDTQWYQAHIHEPQADTCQTILHFRGNVASELFSHIPNLTKLTINWHDSEDSDDSLTMRSEVLKSFDSIVYNNFGEPIDINKINHFEQQGTVHKPSRLVSSMRQELDEILSGQPFC